jgi:hypothetical protein
VLKQESPSLSDMDYSDLGHGGDSRHFLFDDMKQSNNHFSTEMKRSSTDVSINMQQNYYPMDHRMMAGSAPSNMGFHYSSFGPPDDIVSTTSSTNMVSTHSSNEMNEHIDDYSTQAK